MACWVFCPRDRPKARSPARYAAVNLGSVRQGDGHRFSQWVWSTTTRGGPGVCLRAADRRVRGLAIAKSAPGGPGERPGSADPGWLTSIVRQERTQAAGLRRPWLGGRRPGAAGLRARAPRSSPLGSVVARSLRSGYFCASSRAHARNVMNSVLGRPAAPPRNGCIGSAAGNLDALVTYAIPPLTGTPEDAVEYVTAGAV